MTQLDEVDHFVEGLKPETRKEIKYLRCVTLSEVIAAVQANERAHFGTPCSGRRSRLSRESEPENMDISLVRLARPTKEMCCRQNLYYYCRKGGHRIADCPKLPQ